MGKGRSPGNSKSVGNVVEKQAVGASPPLSFSVSRRRVASASFGYLAVAMDRLVDWNSRQSTWETSKLRMAHTFQAHAFPLRYSFAEMEPIAEGLGLDWTIDATAKCIEELVELIQPADSRVAGLGVKPQGELGLALETELPLVSSAAWTPPHITVTNKSGDALDHLADSSVDVVVTRQIASSLIGSV